MSIQFGTDFAAKYVACTPLALALERTLECLLLSQQEFVPPVLDIGCGDGLFAKILFDEAIDTGIDLDAREVACAQKTGAYRELITCAGSDVPKPTGSFQTAFSNSVLEHIPDLGPVLREAHRLLAPGGRFYFTVPTEQFEQQALGTRVLTSLQMHDQALKYRQWYNRFWRHFHALPVEQWKELARSAGFEVSRVIRYNPPGMTTRNDCLAPMGALSSILKRSTGRWVLSPSARQAVLAPFARMIERRMAEHGVSDNGSLVLVMAQKPLANPA